MKLLFCFNYDKRVYLALFFTFFLKKVYFRGININLFPCYDLVYQVFLILKENFI